MKAVIVECQLPGLQSRLEEARSMAEAIGYRVVATLSQRRGSVHHSYCIGPGKLSELKRLVDEKGVGTVIFANTLPSSQVFKIQRHLGGDVRVIDRNLLILDVFDKRAMTREAKLQIKLAKLKYTFSWGKEFIKLRGIMGEQVGWMGPGDYPFKEYHRAARQRISRLEAELEEIYQKKDRLRARRRELGFPIVALAGYTQSGKTTFFNRVTAESKTVGLGPFTTLTTFSRKVNSTSNPNGQQFILVDSIGFIEDMHPIILKAFNTTLGEIANADLIVLFIDASEELEIMDSKALSSKRILEEISFYKQMILCLNKIDLMGDDQLTRAMELVNKRFPGATVVPISAKTGENIDELLRAIEENIIELAHAKVAGKRFEA